jgi:hypothetical protein
MDSGLCSNAATSKKSSLTTVLKAPANHQLRILPFFPIFTFLFTILWNGITHSFFFLPH